MSTKDLQWKKYRDEHYLYKNESDKVPDWFQGVSKKSKKKSKK